jgi:hypothetical protein
MPTETRPPCGDGALSRQTGRNWAEWHALLDAEGAAAMTHQQIVAIVHGKFNGGSWWSQMITVGYERARGLREVGQGRAGAFAVSANKTLPVSAAIAHGFFADADRRATWLDDPVTLRTTTEKSVRLTWPDGTIVAVFITPNGNGKSAVSVDHGKLPSAEAADEIRTHWKAALGRLLAAATAAA